jgi:hypothetical protein
MGMGQLDQILTGVGMSNFSLVTMETLVVIVLYNELCMYILGEEMILSSISVSVLIYLY